MSEEQVQELLKSGTALRHLSEYSQRQENAFYRRVLDKMIEDAPPQPPMSPLRRLAVRTKRLAEEYREKFADGLRFFADRIDPWGPRE